MHLATSHVDECEAFLQSIGWKVGHNQLSPGRYAAAIDGVLAPRAQAMLHRHARSFAGSGHTPKGSYTFGVQIAGKGAMAVNQRVIRSHEIAAQLPYEHIEFKLPPDVALLTVAVDAAHVDRLTDTMFGQPLSQLLRRGNALPCDPRAIAAIASQLAEIATEGASAAACAPTTHALDDAVIDALLGALQPPEPIRGWSARGRIVRRAEALIESDEAPGTVAELCVALAVPARTLEDAFRHCLGVAPRTFLVAMRLNRARRFLGGAHGGANRGVSVTDAAMRFGFFHLGRFSAQYRRLFGELPSETLRRARA
jgi:AraC family ethanolamine operon transcriptional activator